MSSIDWVPELAAALDQLVPPDEASRADWGDVVAAPAGAVSCGACPLGRAAAFAWRSWSRCSSCCSPAWRRRRTCSSAITVCGIRSHFSLLRAS